MKKTKLSALVVLLVLGLVVSAIPMTTTASSLQEESGPAYLNIVGDPEIFVPELRHNVTVYRDNWGVPHIYAQETSDAYFALGYMMAEDRLFEMDLFRRATAGRLSEIFGDIMLEDDILMRTLGIYKIANDTWNGLYPNITISSNVRKYIEQFSNGFNRYVADMVVPDDVPLEYKVLYASTGLPWSWILPYNWTPPDSVAIAGMMGLMLTDTSDLELIRGAYMTYAEPSMPGITDFLMPTGWINMTTIMPPDCPDYEGLGGIEAITEPLKKLLGFSGSVGSNNWVINETMSATGNAMLANDPHLDLQFPGINWQVHMKTDETNVIGVMIPGGPVVYSGHNDYFAFGVTNLGADVLDLYYYVFDNPYPNCTQYWYVDHWENITVRYETVLNLTTPITVPVLSTRHGPLVDIPGVGTYAFRWVAHERGYGEIAGFAEMMLATNLTEWRNALTHMTVIIQNYVYADKQGNIAWWPSGAIPIRNTTDGTLGLVPSNGSAGQNEWIGYVPHDDMPHSINPKQGFIATANNQPAGPGSGYYPYPWIGPAYGFAPGYRAERITELITSLAPLTIDEMIAIQGDSLSIPARIFTPYIINTYTKPIADPWINKTIEYLENWNYTMLRTSIAALIFQVWYEKFETNTFFDEFGASGLYPFPNAIIPLRNMTEGYPTSPWSAFLFDDKSTVPTETRNDIINASLHDAINWLKSRFNSTHPDNMTTWQYGALHVVQFNHPMGEFVSYLNVPTTPVGCDGSPYTVDPGGHYHKLIVQQAYLYVESGASYRGIYECKDNWDTSLILVPPGESGLVTGSILSPVFDPHSTDTFLMWLNNQYTPALFNDTIIQTYPEKTTFYAIQLMGDVNQDGIVDIVDVVIAALAFGSAAVDDPSTPWDEGKNWNPAADLNGDGIVDIIDMVIIGVDFGRKLPDP